MKRDPNPASFHCLTNDTAKAVNADEESTARERYAEPGQTFEPSRGFLSMCTTEARGELSQVALMPSLAVVP